MMLLKSSSVSRLKPFRNSSSQLGKKTATGLLIEAHGPVKIGRSRPAAEGAACERGEDLCGAGCFLTGVGGVAGEDLADAARIFQARRIDRPFDSEEADGKIMLHLRNAV